MAATGGSIAFSSFLSSSNLSHKAKSISLQRVVFNKLDILPMKLVCFAVQESSAAVAPETNEKKEEEEEEVKASEGSPAAAPPKPAAAKKAAAKPLPQMMEEDIIPSLRTTLEAEEDITELNLSFQDYKLEGSFLKKGFPYSFWAFFPNGDLTGPRGFSLSSYGSEVSTVEPFLVDEKKITARHVVFWIEKRLAAQGFIPVWKE